MSIKYLSAVLALSLSLNAAVAQAMAVRLTPSSPMVRVGDVFDLVVSVEGAQAGPYAGDEVLAFGFDLAISDPSLLYWAGAVVAHPPFADDTSGLFLNTDVAGAVGFGAGVMDDSFVLAVLSLLALGEGQLDLGVISDLQDFNEGLIYLAGDAADLTAMTSLTIHPQASTPLPATLVLLLAGIPWLRARRGR